MRVKWESTSKEHLRILHWAGMWERDLLLRSITWIPETIDYYDDIVWKVAFKNYTFITITEENIYNSLDWVQGNLWLNPETILFPCYLDIWYMENMNDIWKYNKHITESNKKTYWAMKYAGILQHSAIHQQDIKRHRAL